MTKKEYWNSHIDERDNGRGDGMGSGSGPCVGILWLKNNYEIRCIGYGFGNIEETGDGIKGYNGKSGKGDGTGHG